MADIRVLSAHLVNKIAAGEVIERPASVVKELVENGLDAGAKRIDVTVEKGGKALIAVSDDGEGMSAENLAKAFLPHATSKLIEEDDLFRIVTMGFRGEALASIASVSHAHIRSRRRDDQEGHEVEASGETLGAVRPCASAAGTTITVRDLFFSTPARRKFLKSDATELGHISEAIARVALPYQEVAFTLTHNGRSVLDLPAADTLAQRAADLFGADLAGELIPIRPDDAATVHVRGLIAPPAAARATTRWQYFFLNGRYIRDRYLSHALKEGYRGLIDPQRQPAALIFIAVPPEEVDVNVHPTKIEVRFRDSQSVHSHLLAALRETLQRSELRPMAQVSTSAGFGEPIEPSARGNVAANGAATAPAAVAPPSAGGELPPEPADDPRRQGLRQALADYFKSQAAQPKLQFPEPRDRPGHIGQAQRPQPAGEVPAPSRPWSQSGAAAAEPFAPPAPARPPQANGAAASAMPAAVPAAHVPGGQAGASVSGPQVLQVHGTYLIVAEGEGITIVDQHALHERILYNQLLRRLSAGPLESQGLLVPAVLAVTPVQRALLEDHAELLGRLGIEVSDFGPGKVAIQRFPSFLDKLDPAAFLADLADQLSDEDPSLDRERLLHQVLDMMACKAAVKAGDDMGPQEIQSLLDQRETAEKSTACPHGRPTQIRLTVRDLEKQFKRG